MTTDIGNCPWPGCGGAAAVAHPSHNAHYVECVACKSCGPMCETEEAAITAWQNIAGPDVVIGRLRWNRHAWGDNLYCGSFFLGGVSADDLTPGYLVAGKADWQHVGSHAEKHAALEAAVRKAIGGVDV